MIYFLPNLKSLFSSILTLISSPFILVSNSSTSVELFFKLFCFPLICLYLSHHFFFSFFPNVSLLFSSTWCCPGISPWTVHLFVLHTPWMVSSLTQRIDDSQIRICSPDFLFCPQLMYVVTRRTICASAWFKFSMI